MNVLRLVASLLSPATVCALLGLVLLVTGLALVYPPLAYIVPGCLLLTFGLWLVWPQGAA